MHSAAVAQRVRAALGPIDARILEEIGKQIGRRVLALRKGKPTLLKSPRDFPIVKSLSVLSEKFNHLVSQGVISRRFGGSSAAFLMVILSAKERVDVRQAFLEKVLLSCKSKGTLA